ncbi:4Fe-4S binding protein [Candidatus Latescibacterota bacterium]
MTDNSKKTKSFSYKLRPLVQGLFLIFFIYLFLKISYPLQKNLATNFFYNFDPLVSLIMVLSGTFFVAALLYSVFTIIFTVLFGRMFCGWMCPMGTIFDLSKYIIPTKKAKKPFGNSPYKNIKYYVLIFLVSGSLLGFSAVIFFDPLVFLFRVFTVNVYPYVVLGANQFLNLIRPLAFKAGALNLSMLSIEQPAFTLQLFSLSLFIAVIGLISLERRFWCRNLCPLGALLAVLARFSIRGRRVNDECIYCAKCAKSCPMNAITDNYQGTSPRECIQCERCKNICPVNAISFEFGSPLEEHSFNPSRRGILLAGTGGIITAFGAGTLITTQSKASTLLRPPGAIVEKDFLDTCLRCGECMKGCPTHGLQPAGLSAGLEGLFSPVLTPRVGACEEQCNICGQICPTGAIRNLSLEEKQYAVIGNATIERNLCIAWEQGKVCLICDEVCPYDAVEFRLVKDEMGTSKRPFVIEDKCVGCGQCEKGCPVNGPAAIHVTPVNEVRKNSGSYITEEVRRLREVTDDQVDFSKETGVPAENSIPYQIETEPEQDDFENDLPAGFN